MASLRSCRALPVLRRSRVLPERYRGFTRYRSSAPRKDKKLRMRGVFCCVHLVPGGSSRGSRIEKISFSLGEKKLELPRGETSPKPHHPKELGTTPTPRHQTTTLLHPRIVC